MAQCKGFLAVSSGKESRKVSLLRTDCHAIHHVAQHRLHLDREHTAIVGLTKTFALPPRRIMLGLGHIVEHRSDRYAL